MEKWRQALEDLKQLDEDELEFMLDILPDEYQPHFQEHFKYHPEDWIDLCVYAYDPESPLLDKCRKYKLFPAQVDLIKELQPYAMDSKLQPDVKAWEKSRRIGWTNTCLVFLVWAAIYWNASSIVAAQDQDTTDTLDNEQVGLMERIRTVYRRLPWWMQNEIDYSSKHMNIRFNRATIKGKATGSKVSGGKAGRGGRVTFALLDECGFWDSSTFENAFNALAPTSKIRICISSAAETNTHAFSRLIDGDLTGKKYSFVPYSVNPANTEEYIESMRLSMTPSKHLQEYYGQRGGSQAKIMTTTQEASFIVPDKMKQPDGKKYWTANHPFIKDIFKFSGKLVIGWDGGKTSNYSAAVPIWVSDKNDRWIVLNNFSNDPPGGELLQVIEKCQNFIVPQYLGNKTEDYGDITLRAEAEIFYAATKRQINTLEHLQRPSQNLSDYMQEKYSTAFRQRMVKRTAVTEYMLGRRLSDGLPQVIFLEECDMLRKGFLDGDYQWETKHGEVIRGEIHQNHPIVDVCDAITYPFLCIYPILPNETEKNKGVGVVYR